MMTFTTAIAATAFCYAGMTALASAMDRHHADISAPATTPRRLAQAVGGMLLALAWLPCAQASGASVGSAAWCGFLGVGATLVALTLSYRPRSARLLACAALAVAIPAALL